MPRGVGRAALHDHLIRSNLGKAAGRAAVGQPGKDLLHDGQVVAGAEEVLGEEIDGLGRCGRGRGASLPRRNLLGLGQRDVANVDGNSADRLNRLVGAPALQTCPGLGQEGLRLVEITGNIQEQAGGRGARLRFQER